MSRNAPTVEFIKLVAVGLGDLNDKSIFVGGATVPFYLPTEMQAAARATEDVDVVLEVITPGNREKFEETLRKKGFRNDTSEGAPLCRWKLNGVTVDIMSPRETVLGFTNRWYSDAAKAAMLVNAGGVKVRILTLPYFLGTKFEAFKGRGKKDYMGSPDMEDIVTILDGASESLLEAELPKVEADLRKFLSKSLLELSSSRDFRAALPGSVFDRANAGARAEAILDRIASLCKILETP